MTKLVLEPEKFCIPESTDLDPVKTGLLKIIPHFRFLTTWLLTALEITPHCILLVSISLINKVTSPLPGIPFH